MGSPEMDDLNRKDENSSEVGEKIQRSVESMLKQMEASAEELMYRTENFSNVDLMKNYLKYLKCTKCNQNFQQTIKKGQKVSNHPLLGVLMCDSCCDYYGDGNFSLDSEGEDKYCRWCGEGGTIFSCSKCICGFCDVCINKHFGEDGLEAVKNDDDWICYFCNSKPLWQLRSICFFAKETAKVKRKQFKKKRESCSSRKKRRRKEKLDDSNISSSDLSSSEESSSRSDYSIKKPTKRKRVLKQLKEEKKDESSSSEDEKENQINSKKKPINLKRRCTGENVKGNTPKKDTKDLKEKPAVSSSKNADCDQFDSKKTVVLEKLKSIWKLTQTVAEVGLCSSREKLKTLSKSNCFKTLEDLKKEHEELKSCMNVLMPSLNTAFTFLSAIKDDLTFDTAIDEKEIFQRQETELEKLANKFQEQSNIKTSVDSDGGLSSEESTKKKERVKRPTSGGKKLRKESINNKKHESDENSNEEGNRKSLSLCSGSCSEENVENREAEKNSKKKDKNKKNLTPSGNSETLKPFLKVKSFAKMFEENIYDKSKAEKTDKSNPVVVDLCDLNSEESEDEGQKEKHKNDCEKKTTDSTQKKDEKVSEKSNFEKQLPGVESDNRNSDGEASGKKSDDENENQTTENTRKKSDTRKDTSSEKSEDENAKESSDESTIIDKRESENEISNDDSKKLDDSSESKKELIESNKDSADEKTRNNSSADESSKERDEQKRNPKAKSKNKSESSSSESEQEKISSKEKERKDVSDGGKSERSSGEEHHISRKTRNKAKEKTELKATFEKFKKKREKFLKSTKSHDSSSLEEKGVARTKLLESSESESEKKETGRFSGKQKKKRILTSSDEEDGRGTKETEDSDEEKSDTEKLNQKSGSEIEKPSSDDTNSDEETNARNRKRIRKKKSSSDSSQEETKNHKKKKKQKVSSSDSSTDDETKQKKKGRRNIKKILKKDSLEVETKEALKNEEERKKRLKEKHKLFEELFSQGKEGDVSKQIVLDFDPETKKPLVKVHKKLAKKLKPHQVKGVRFMWDNCFESVKKLEEESGSGCILAHCMGLGKTLQVITLVHTVMNHDLGVNTVLIVCPLSTVSNWIREFETWLGNIRTDPITLYDLVKYKKLDERRFHLTDWHKNGGVLVLSYDLFRNLTKDPTKKEKKKKQKYLQAFEKALLDPGPDLVVCDEGHLLKNEDTALSKSVSRIKTSRRIVLTGTPLQNNLIEYHCMVQFVKPNILGTRKEFCNRFVNPINNGQFEDSTELDVKIMKRRSHVLHSMLDGCIQRFDYSVLTPFLPEKHEYVLSISLTEAQTKAYLHFIEKLSARSSGSSKTASLFSDYHNLQRIWTHPRTMLMQSEKESQKELLKSDSEGSLKDFVVSSDEESSQSSSDSSVRLSPEPRSRKRVLRSNANAPEVVKAIEEEEKLLDKHWWDEFFDEKSLDDIRESNKLIVLFSLLKYCAEKKDKVLVFSQSLYSLDLIEYFLSKIDENSHKDDDKLCGHQDTWVLGSDYFRLDGSTNSELRAIWCKHFNKESNTRARLFLISTRAGGLGINLYGANRVVIFDASWNPSHDLQSIFRVYRFGQKKTCYIYRFLAEATMEEKIYERQVTKLSLAHRVIDEHQIERHYTMGNLQELYTFEPTPKDQRKVPKLPKDSVLADLLANHKEIISRYHEHDSLLENKQEEELSEEERKAAWKEYEDEKVQKTFILDPAVQQQFLMMQQAQMGFGGTGVRVLNPAFLNQPGSGQNVVNPMYLQPNIPLDVLQRGAIVGVTPLPGESLESYLTRIFNRESWIQPGSGH